MGIGGKINRPRTVTVGSRGVRRVSRRVPAGGSAPGRGENPIPHGGPGNRYREGSEGLGWGLR